MGCAVIVTMAAGCGGGLDLDDVEHRAIEAACTREVRCGYAPDVASCIDDTQLSPWYASYIRSLVAAAKAGAVTYDADAAAACFDLSATATCGSASTLLAEDPCAAMFRGTRATQDRLIEGAGEHAGEQRQDVETHAPILRQQWP